VGIVDFSDIGNAVKLVLALLKKLDSHTAKHFIEV